MRYPARYGLQRLPAGLLLAVFAGISLLAQQPLRPGTPAPGFELKGTDGRQYSLKTFAAAEVLVIAFTCNHCPTAQAYEEKLKALARDYADRKVALVAISSNDPLAIRLDELGYTDLGDSFEEMKIRAKAHDFNFPYLYDGETQAVARAYGAQATPHVFVLDKNRTIRYQGRFDDTEKPGVAPRNKDVLNAVDDLLAGREVRTGATKTFGCSMKFSDKRGSVEQEKKGWETEPVTLEKTDESGLRELLANRSEKLRLINVWATWCGPCVTEFPDLLTMHRMYRGRDFELVTVSADSPDKEPAVLRFLQKRFASSKNYLFGLADKYKLIEAVDPNWQGALPYTLLVAPGGKILYARQGPVDPLALRRLIVESETMGRYY